MVEHFCLATGASSERIMQAYDHRTEDATVALMGQLPTESGLDLLGKLEEAAAEAELAPGSEAPSIGIRR